MFDQLCGDCLKVTNAAAVPIIPDLVSDCLGKYCHMCALIGAEFDCQCLFRVERHHPEGRQLEA